MSAEAAGSAGYDAQGWRSEGQVHSMSGRSAVYFVDSHMSGRWRCTCPDYLVRRQNSGEDCKHIMQARHAAMKLQAGAGDA